VQCPSNVNVVFYKLTSYKDIYTFHQSENNIDTIVKIQFSTSFKKSVRKEGDCLCFGTLMLVINFFLINLYIL
jgi:hypothetical protein